MNLRQVLTGTALAVSATFAVTSAAHATTVATIDGCYDCVVFDTPTLVINNSTGGTMTGAALALHGYQDINAADSASVSLGNLGGGATTLNWGSLPGVSGATVPHNLTAYDYDDEYAGTALAIPDPHCGFRSSAPGGCVPGGGPFWYSDPGNFNVTFTATISGGLYDGMAVFSVFSPHVNATGHFVGWEGLDQDGFSESDFDVHSGVITGDLANIDLGLPPPPPGTGGVPEPATWALMLVGFGGLGAALRSRRRVAIA